MVLNWKTGLAAGLALVAVVVLIVVGVSTVTGRGDPGILAVQPGPPARDPQPWEDIRWTQAADPRMVLTGRFTQRIASIAVHGSLLVGVGEGGRPGAKDVDSFPAVFVSSDAQDWRMVEITSGIPPGDTAYVHRVASGAGVLIASGEVCCSTDGQAIWRSIDGLTWDRISPDPLRDFWPARIAGGPDGFVAVGSRGPRAAILVSPDGVEWTEIDPAGASLHDGAAYGVTRAADRWIVTGSHDAGTWDGAVWESTDLLTWKNTESSDPVLAADDEISLYRPVAYAGGLYVSGANGTTEARRQCEGVGAADPAIVGIPDAGLVDTVGCGWEQPANWRWTEGAGWTLLPAPEPGPGGRRLEPWATVAAGGPGLVAIGPEQPAFADGHEMLGTWVSADGATWKPIGAVPQFPRGMSLNDFVVLGRTIVAVGETWKDDWNSSDAWVLIGTVAGE